MILGKRHRPPIKRTTSMTEFTLDLNGTAAVGGGHDNPQPPHDRNNPFNTNTPPSGSLDHRFLTATISPRNHRRNSLDHMETAHFLTVCHLCNRRLIPGRDIFMYRGDSAFCSLECRQQQMIQDAKKPVALSSE
ncbi:FCS-Like Zinc finger 6 [Lactuca sativa]|uniref:FLZ-type domain-containing protein n=1 Tax=Lactuca sativa TaxID=4236 RepID=A0A9R1VB68_LACSA|nr:FCS-Like Zinc finger 6 [Lactuca sativa]KAJ0202184.1 hypothetical protein LSAT_V11C600336910 [Lactuca sativa]